MGSFIGHAIPGGFFFLYGCWWILAVLYRYNKCRGKRNVVFQNTPTFSVVRTRCGQVDIESLLGVGATVIGILVELVAAPLLRGPGIGYNSIQHATMYFFFCLVSLSRLFKFYLQRHFADVDKLSYILFTTALLAEGILFKFHLFGRSELDVLVHTLLLYCIWVSAAVTLAEMMYRDSILLPLARGTFTALQGTWFWQVGFILYNPIPGAKPWEENDHHQLMLAATFFTWHAGALLGAVIITGIVMSSLLTSPTYNQNGTALQDIQATPEQYRALLNDPEDNETFAE